MSIKTNLTFAVLIFGLFIARTQIFSVSSDSQLFGATKNVSIKPVKKNQKSSLLSNKVGLFASSISGVNARTSRLVFIDNSLNDYGLLERSIDLRNTRIILLNPKKYEGIQKMTEEIRKHEGLQSIHIVGHAKQAELTIGSDNFWKDDLNMITKELNSWKSHVSADADLFLYGCSLANTVDGKETVDLMASLTGMDVTASTNLTGHASLNADWDLEYSTGPIESSIAFSEEVENYAYTLQSLTFADLRNFEEVDEGTPGNWTYPDGTGRTAYQANNTGGSVFLLSAGSGYLNEVFKGTITVDSDAGDDDDIGFAFGFNGVNDTYIWSWDKGGISMGVRSGGAHLLYKKTSSSKSFPAGGTLIAQGANNDPWSHGVTYQIEILYTADNIRIKVNGVEKFNVTAADAGVAEFPAGRFGFYNYSQGGVTFGNIQNAPASDDPIPPSAQDDSYGTSPNTTLNVDFIDGILSNDYDANLDDFTIVQVSNVSHGSLTLDTNDGSFTYVPTSNYEGVDSFTYKLVQDDNGAESSVRTVSIGIISSNQAPTDIQLSNASISEGAAENTNIGTLTTTDANNPDDQHDYSLADNGGGRFTVNGNSLVVANSSLLTPGNYNITVRSTDLFDASTTKVFTITVVSNDKPTSADGEIQMDSGSNYVFSSSDFSFNDTDGDTFGGISIITAETAGDLEYDESDVFDGTLISDISLLNFISPSNSLGDPYASFTFKVVDSRGGISTSSYTMNIEVQDNVDPTAIAQNVVVQLDASGSGSTTAELVDNGSNDDFGIASLALDKTDFSCSDIATNPNAVTLTVTDNNGNTSTANAEVTVQDQIDPVAITQDITVQLDSSGNAVITPTDIDNGSTDNCSVATLALDQTDFTCADIGANTVTLSVTDGSGNSNATTAVVTIADTILPTVVTQDITVQLDASGNAIITPAEIDNGSTDNCSVATLALDQTDFTCADIGENTVILTVIDVNGNSNTATSVVTVADTVLPTVVTQDITVQLNVSGNAVIAPADIDNGSTDNCSVATLALSQTDFTCADIGENTVTLTVVDVNGNTNTATSVVTLEDSIPPTLITQDITLNLDVNGLLSVTPEDFIDSSDDNCAISTTDIDRSNFDCADLGQYSITITVTDASGHTTTETAVLTVSGDDNDGDLKADPCDTDDDNDGTPDTDDDFPFDEDEDTDTDGDGTGDNEDTDDDDDGTPDADDDFPFDEDEDADTDGDGTGDNEDTDDDDDGTPDTDDDFPLDKDEDTDTDGDGTGDNEDTDDDDDGTPDTDDDFPLDEDEDTDTDGDGTGDNEDTDDDDDGTPDTDDDFPLDEDEDTDFDGDGTGDNTDTDDDNDGIPDSEDSEPRNSTDSDNDGIPDSVDDDDDNDGVPDNDDAFPLDENENTDTDGDGTGDNSDEDDDNDGTTDEEDDFPLDENEDTDSDSDGTGDNADNDDDNDGVTDIQDDFPTNNEPVLRPAEAFTPNGDGVNDSWVIPGIDNYPNAKVTVYNRWGHVVFTALSYRNDWKGNYNSNSDLLPPGSYLYAIDLGNGKTPMQGWIFINY